MADDEIQPGDVIQPGGQPQPALPDNDSPSPETSPSSSWSFQHDEQPKPVIQPDASEVSWTASEYIAHQKNAGWYIFLVLGAAAVAGLIYLLTDDEITLAMIIIVAVIFGIFAARQPRTLNYQLDEDGVTIGEKHYPYALFKSFSVQEEGAINSINFMPMQRLMPGLSLYCPPEQEDHIIETLVGYLPHEERPPDVLDKFMRKIRF